MLKELLKKMKKQEDLVQPTEAKTNLDKERLQAILADHGIDTKAKADFVEDLLEWKKHL